MLIPDREQNGEDRHSSCEVEIEVGATSRNVTVQPDFDFAMSVSFGPVKAAEDGVLADAKTPCVALVPVSEPAPWTRTFPLWRLRPDSIFVAHLIATAEQVPQVRNLRRATPADAQTAYGANQRQIPCAGIRTRQII
jgi:hypothetical protein